MFENKSGCNGIVCTCIQTYKYSIRKCGQMVYLKDHMNQTPSLSNTLLQTIPPGTHCLSLLQGYFHHQNCSTVSRYSTQSQTLTGINIGLSINSNVISFYNPLTRSDYTTSYYNLYLGCHNNIHFGLTYYGVIFVDTYTS